MKLKMSFMLIAVAFISAAQAESIKINADYHKDTSSSEIESGDSETAYLQIANKKTRYFISGGLGIALPFYSDYTVYSCERWSSGYQYCTDTNLAYDFPSSYLNINLDGGVRFGKKTDMYNYGFSAFYNILNNKSVTVEDYNDIEYKMNFEHSIYGIAFDNYFGLREIRGLRTDIILGLGYAGISSEIKENDIVHKSTSGAPFINLGTLASFDSGWGVYFYTKYFFPQDTIDIIFGADLGVRYTF